MKNLVSKSVIALSLFTALVSLGTSLAAAAPPAPNLEVMAWQGNSSPLVESPYVYTARVRNIGNQTAQSVVLTIDFPLTNTSPTRYILGKLSGVVPSSGTCSTANNKITCSLGNLSNNQTKQVSFTFEFQVATAPPIFTATASTGSTNEQNPGNNSRAFAPALNYPTNIVTAGTYLVSSCTGIGLTSFYECEMAPSSIQSRLSLEFNLGGTLSVTDYPIYTGFWDQNTLSDKSLHFTITGGNSDVDFNGFAVSQNCFKGITTFPGSTSPYNSAYRVCRQ